MNTANLTFETLDDLSDAELTADHNDDTDGGDEACTDEGGA